MGNALDLLEGAIAKVETKIAKRERELVELIKKRDMYQQQLNDYMSQSNTAGDDNYNE